MKTRVRAGSTSASGKARITPQWPLARFLSPGSTLREALTGASRLAVHAEQRTASDAGASSANGALRPTTDFLAIGAYTNPGSGRVEFRQSARAEGLGWITWRRSRRRPAGGSERDRACIQRPTGNWRQPPKTPIRGMAPSSYPRISWRTALASIPKSCPTELRQVVAIEAVAPGPNDGNNAREWRPTSEGERARTGLRPAIGAVHPYNVGPTNSPPMRWKNQE